MIDNISSVECSPNIQIRSLFERLKFLLQNWKKNQIKMKKLAIIFIHLSIAVSVSQYSFVIISEEIRKRKNHYEKHIKHSIGSISSASPSTTFFACLLKKSWNCAMISIFNTISRVYFYIKIKYFPSNLPPLPISISNFSSFNLFFNFSNMNCTFWYLLLNDLNLNLFIYISVCICAHYRRIKSLESNLNYQRTFWSSHLHIWRI